MLFANRHFINLLGDILTYKPGTSKLEKFFAQKVKEKLQEIRTNQKIDEAFTGINAKIQARLRRLRETKFDTS